MQIEHTHGYRIILVIIIIETTIEKPATWNVYVNKCDWHLIGNGHGWIEIEVVSNNWCYYYWLNKLTGISIK
jgi:hypothetical protein